MRHFLFTTLSVFTLIFLVNAGTASAHGPFKTYSVKAAFDDVVSDAENAVINQGLVIDFRADVGEMLARTMKDVGGKKKVYNNAKMLMFCSAKYTREAVEADPTNIMFCPYSMMVFELADEPGTVHVGYRVPKRGGSIESRQALLAIENLLDTIAQEATGN
ncbi:DUF302 domain-containing protein [Magnetovibrio sp. PR-2]|uniref:DUF302 domain-containing protein n=1 Tax=Magnetovibrio sp. PR-2 TaxID=3120356 RepID=UPI002FCDFC7C